MKIVYERHIASVFGQVMTHAYMMSNYEPYDRRTDNKP